MARMDPAIGREWVSDLRDPNRMQGTGCLRDGEGRQCCLDVLNEQFVRKGGTQPPVLNHGVYEYFTDDGEIERSYLLPAVVDWAGLGDNDPLINYGGSFRSLSELNDNLLLSFPQIADLIEEQLL